MVLFGVLKLAIDGEVKHSKAASQRGGLGRIEEGDIIHDLNPPVFPSSPVSRPPKATPGLQSSGLPAGVWLLGELSRAWLSRAPGSLSAFFFALLYFQLDSDKRSSRATSVSANILDPCHLARAAGQAKSIYRPVAAPRCPRSLPLSFNG